MAEDVLKGQLEIISAYIGKIDLDHWTIERVRDSLGKDFEYLQQEFGLLQANKILNNENSGK